MYMLYNTIAICNILYKTYHVENIFGKSYHLFLSLLEMNTDRFPIIHKFQLKTAINKLLAGFLMITGGCTNTTKDSKFD